jgi:hemin uptake protein HemP
MRTIIVYNHSMKSQSPDVFPTALQPAGTRASPLPSERLFRGQSEVWIQHGDTTYRLSTTALGKLILTK